MSVCLEARLLNIPTNITPNSLKKKTLEFLPQIITLVKSKKIKIYAEQNFAELLWELQEKGFAGQRTSITELSLLIIEQLSLKTEYFTDAKGKIKHIRYHNDKVDELEIINSLFGPYHYFSHNTVLDIILNRVPQHYYVTSEQPASEYRERPILIQENIDQAFKIPQKVSQSVLYWNQKKIHLLRRRPEKKLSGVIRIRGRHCLMTNLERTMLDLVVRPDYAVGGAESILRGFIELRDSLNLENLYDYLITSQYLYPYHQSIGFYLQAAGYTVEQYKQFFQPAINLDFYLEYGMKQKIYNAKWKIYHPKNIVIDSIKPQ
jgi:hypothetical protein